VEEAVEEVVEVLNDVDEILVFRNNTGCGLYIRTWDENI